MHHFLFWSRTLAEHQFFRNIWVPLRVLASISQSSTILSIDAWVEERNNPAAHALRACKQDVVSHLDASRIGRGLRTLYRQPGVNELFAQWWEESIIPRVQEPLREFFRALFVYDMATQPVHGEVARMREQETAELHDQTFFVRRQPGFAWDFEGLVAEVKRHGTTDPVATVERFRIAQPQRDCVLYLQPGFEQVIDNHETVLRYVGKTREELEHEHEMRVQGLTATTTQMHVAGLPDRSVARSLPVVEG
jgi:hypothetical protein